MLIECKDSKSRLTKALVNYKIKLARLPTVAININPLPNVDELFAVLNRGIKLRAQMAAVKCEPNAKSTRSKSTRSKSTRSKSTSSDSSPITPTSIPKPPFPLTGVEITDPKYSNTPEGLLNRYNDLAIYCQACVDANVQGEPLNIAKSYMHATYTKIKSRKIPLETVFLHFH